MSALPAQAVELAEPAPATAPVEAPATENVVKLEAFASSNDKVINDLVAKLNIIASKVANPLAEKAIALPAAEHSEADIKRVFNFVGVTITPENIAQYIPLLDEAKSRVRLALSQAQPSDPAAPATATTKPKKAAKVGKSDEEKAKAKAERDAKKAEAKAKREAEKAERKAKREAERAARGEAKKVETVEHPVFAVAAASVTLNEDRTKMLALPETFFLEADPATIGKHRGHQVDPSRVQSYTPVMPNVKLMAVSGNPYPTEADDTVKTSDTYKDFVKVSHFTFAKFRELGTMAGYPEEAIVTEILERAGVPNNSGARTCIQDTLRDLTLYGYATQYLTGRSRSFKLKA